MPKTSTASLQALLAPYGLRLTVADGQLSILEGVSALPAKTVTLAFVAKMKPDGSVGRGAPEGYNLQDAMELSNEHYKVLQDIARLILQRTHSINTNESISKQRPGSIDLCIKKLLTIHPELHAYKPFGYWALRATFQLLLRNKSGQANTLARELKKIQMVVESGGELPKPATKPRRQRGRPRKNPAPAPEDTDTTTNEPTAPVQPPLAPASGSNTAAPHDNSGEVFDIRLEDEMDISIREAIHELSGMSLNVDGSDNDKDDDDGGAFDMAQVISASAPTANTGPVPTIPEMPDAPASAAPTMPATPATPATPAVAHAPAVPATTPVAPAPTAPATPPTYAAPLTDAQPLESGVPPALPAHSNPTPTATIEILPSDSDSIIWRGLTINSDNMTRLRSIATRRATGAKPRFAKIYDDLIAKLIADPNYDPSSDPDPVPQVTAKAAPKSKPKPKAKAAPMSEPGLEPNHNSGKGKGKAVVEATDAPVRRSGREFKQTKR